MGETVTDPAATLTLESASELLDKLILKQLHLMENKMSCEMNIETSINGGSLHLAKSRYIMGQNSVCATRLPLETSSEFAASTLCERKEEDGVTQLNVVENNADNIINPLHWFGILVPQNLHKAQSIFQNTINYVVECVNVQLQLDYNMRNISLIREFKKMIQRN